MAENDDDFEGTLDATLVDVILPADGEYFVAVSLSPQPATIELGGRYELLLSRFRVLPEGGSLPSVPGDTLVGGPGSDRLRGGAADDLFLAADAVIGDLADEILGGRGDDTLDLMGLDFNYSLPPGHSVEHIINANIAPSANLTGIPSTSIDEGSHITVSLTGASDPSVADSSAGFRFGFVLRNDRGDVISGALPENYAAASTVNAQSFTLPDSGTYQVTARIFDQQNGFRDYSAEVNTSNVAPSGTLTGPASVGQGVPTGYTIAANDVSSIDAASLRYSFAARLEDLATSYATASSSNTGSITFTTLGNQIAFARVFDKDNGQLTLQLPVNVIVATSVTLVDHLKLRLVNLFVYRSAARGCPSMASYWSTGVMVLR